MNEDVDILDCWCVFWACMCGNFVGGIRYARMGMKRSVLLSLVLMAVSNFSFAWLAATGKSNWGMAGAIGFENFASGIGGVVVIAYFRSEEHTSELQSLMRHSYAVFCLKKKKQIHTSNINKNDMLTLTVHIT